MDKSRSLYENHTAFLILTNKAELSNTFLYDTPYDLLVKYQFEACQARYSAKHFMDPYAQAEIEFYILMDYLTFIPFGDLGRQYCADQKTDIASLKYERSLSILKKARIDLNEEELYKLKLFFDTYDNNLQPLTPVGYANIVRKLNDRLYNMLFMRIRDCFTSNLLGAGLNKITREISDGELKQFDLEKIFSRLPNMQSLDEAQIAFLENALRACR